MPIPVAASKVLLLMVKELALDVIKQSSRCAEFNDLPNIPWPMREQVRSIQGKLDRIDEDLILLLDKLDTPEAERMLTEIWGPIEEDAV